MSRIGKKPISVPDKVKISINAGVVLVEGPKGKIERKMPPGVVATVNGKELLDSRENDERLARSMHGLARTLLDNMVKGVVTPYKKSLEVSGVGYRAEVGGGRLKIQCGYSHDVLHPLPPGIACKVEGALIHLESVDKDLLGQTAAAIRAYKPCEPYKGKGIRYTTEKIRRKEGKKGAA